MSAAKLVRLRCDKLSCTEYLQTPSDSAFEARNWAAKQGWTNPKGGTDLCPAHSEAPAAQ